jgi:putative glutamine amidotransferase
LSASSFSASRRKNTENPGVSGTFASAREEKVRPVIGLTTYLQQAQTGVWDVRASFLPAIYIEGVNLAGGIASLLPPQPVDGEIAARILNGLDGLIITGGRDVVPESYGQQPHPATDEAVADNRI